MTDQQKTKTQLLEDIRSLKKRIAKLESAAIDQQAAEQAFYESEVRYRSVFENTGTATIIIEQDMTVSMVNAQFVNLSGYSKEEIEGRMKWTEFVAREDVERMKGYHVKRRRDASSAPKEYECRVANRFGEIRDMHVRIDMIPGTQNSVASFMDVTKFKQTEAALIESEQRLTNLMGHLPGMAYRCQVDADRTMLFVSDGCAALTGYVCRDLVKNRKHSYMSLVHPDDQKKVREQIREALNTSRTFHLEYRIVDASGQSKWVWEEGLGIVSPDGDVVEMEGFISDITEHKLEEQQLRKENIHLRSTISERFKFGEIIGKNPAMQEVYERISKAAATDANIIIYGESGTGKELVASAIHNMSDNADRPFVPVNCSAIPETLFESEFFGYKKGAFTGAIADKPGYFDLADGGTLFLDELGEIDLNAQAKLLRVIEGGGYTPVGGRDHKTAEVRIIGATNRDLKEEVKLGRMREDFFYRIHIIPITLPPLRDRKDDLPLLIDHLMSRYAEKGDLPPITGKVLEALYNYDWPGNVRELQNVLQRYVTLKTLDFMNPQHSSEGMPAIPAGDDMPEPAGTSITAAIDAYEKQIIAKTLEKNRWHKQKTAAALGIDRKTLFRKMKKYGLE